ncbi:MAG: hypothetical protein KatS3mg081_1152 [Gemmatimonadales bacterium]|nr:hypothetical protein HRbin33_00394 [bacterium HR33]GIW51797.1 MAG: hypothetical protein KatS3mg081_1152 [Gemmatimonadales bacterium]
MNPLLRTAFLGAAWAASAGVFELGAQSASAAGPLSRLFPVGETLVYDARFGFINVGTAAMQVSGVDTIRGAPTLHVTFVLQGGTFFYRLNDRMDSWFGLYDFASRRFVQDFDEGGRQRYVAYEIYPDSGYYRLAGADTAIPTVAQPLDDAAFFYFARTVPFEPGRRFEFDRYFRPDRNPVVLEVIGRDTIDVPAGRFPTVVIKPTIKGRGILAEAADPRMWLSDDERRIMVQLKTRFPFGTITLRLTKVEQRRTSPPEPEP